MTQKQNGFTAAIGSIMLLLLKICIGIFMVPVMALWQGLKFFRRHVYNQGGWLREISGAVVGITGGIALARKHVSADNPNAYWWVLAGFGTALAIYAYVYPALFWVLIRPLLPYLRAFIKNSLEFLRLLCVDIYHAFCWFVEKFIWDPICWTWNNVVYPILRFVWVDLICRAASCIRWCWNTFWHLLRLFIEKSIDILEFLLDKVIVPVCEFLWNRILKPLGRLIRYCWRQFCSALRWTWHNIIVPAAKFTWNKIIVPLAKFVWNRILVPFWSFVCKCARGLRQAFYWALDHLVVPVLEFVWKQIICRIGRFIESCWDGFWSFIAWIYDNVVCLIARFIWNQIICRIGRMIRWLWNTLVAKPLQWVWKHIVHPLLDMAVRVVSKVWNYVSRLFVHTYYSTSTSAELLSHVLGLGIPIGMIGIYYAAMPHISTFWLTVLAVPAIFAVPLAYVWGGKVLRMAGNWITGFAVSFSSAYLIGLGASQFVSLRSAVEIGSGAGILLFFVLYPIIYSGFERLSQGGRLELAILSLFKAGYAKVESKVSVVSGLCVGVWIYIQNTLPDFLYRTWTDTWNWIQRVLRHFGG